MADVIATMRARFLRSVRVDDTGCWIWVGVTDRGKNKYGQFSCCNKNIRAHRAAYELWKLEQIPEGMLVRHTCDNPPCVNPDHLILGTHLDNSADMVSRGRQASGAKNGKHTCPDSRSYGMDNHRAQHPEEVRGEKNPRARLTGSQVREIRSLRLIGVKLDDLADMFQVSQPTIEAIVYGRTWGSVK